MSSRPPRLGSPSVSHHSCPTLECFLDFVLYQPSCRNLLCVGGSPAALAAAKWSKRMAALHQLKSSCFSFLFFLYWHTSHLLLIP